MPQVVQVPPQTVGFGPWLAPAATASRESRGAATLAERLEEHGVQGPPESFRRLLSELAEELFPGQTFDQILCSDDSVRLCDAVRRRLGVVLPNELIRQELLRAGTGR